LSDTSAYLIPGQAVYVTGAGTLKYRNTSGMDITIAVVTGYQLISPDRIYSGGTGATGIKVGFPWGAAIPTWTDANILAIPGWNAVGFDPALGAGKFQRSNNFRWRYTGSPADEIPSTGFTDRYVDPVNGNDLWDGTSPVFGGGLVGPWKNLQFALTVATVSALRIIVPDKSVFDFRIGGGRPWSTTSRRVPAALRTIIINTSAVAGNFDPALGWRSSTEMQRKSVWSYDSTHKSFSIGVYANGDDTTIPDFDWKSSPGATGGTTLPTGCIIDEALTDPNTGPARYLQVATETAVRDNPYTFAYVRSSSTKRCTVFVNTGSTDPSSVSGLRIFANVYGGSLNTVIPSGSDNKELYLVKGTFEGGYNCFSVGGVDGGSSRNFLVFWQCTFRYARGGRTGFTAELPCNIRHFYSSVYSNGNDGIRYTSTMTATERGSAYLIRAFEVGCQSFWNGSTGAAITDNDTPNSSLVGKVNGFTSHKGCLLVRVAAVAYSNGGPNYGDAATGGYIRSLNFGCTSWRSLGSTTKSEGKVHFAVYGYGGTLPDSNPDSVSGAQAWLIDHGFWTEDGEIINADDWLYMSNEQVANVSKDFGKLIVNSVYPALRVKLSAGATQANNYQEITY